MTDTATLSAADEAEFRERCRAFLKEHAVGISRESRGEDRGAGMMATAKDFQGKLAAAGLAGVVYDKAYGGAGLTRAHERIWREEYANFPDMTSSSRPRAHLARGVRQLPGHDVLLAPTSASGARSTPTSRT